MNTYTRVAIISNFVARSPSEADSLDSELVARTLASIDNEEGEVFTNIFIHIQQTALTIDHHDDDYYKVVYEMAIMDYETGIKHTPEVRSEDNIL